MFDARRLQAQLVLKGKKTEDVANALDINTATYYRKLNRNGDFTREEMEKMISFLEIEEPMAIFFAEADA